MKLTILNPQDTNSPLSEVSCALVSEMSLPLLKNTEEISPGAEVLEGNAPSLQDPPKPLPLVTTNSQSWGTGIQHSAR